MLSYDKIIKGLLPGVKETIDLLVKEGNIKKLQSWLNDCKKELEARNEYFLQCEKCYLEMVLS